MKIVRGLLYFTAGFFILLCILVAVCAFRPDLSERIAEVLYPGKRQTVTAETDGGLPEPEAAVGVGKDHGEESSDRQQSNVESAENEEFPEKEPGMEEKIASDYIPPDQSEIVPPEKVAGRNGYQQIEGQQEQVDETAAREIENRVDTGYTGDDLEFDGLYYPYYAMLNEKGRHIYRQIYANVGELYQTFAPVEAVTSGELKNILSAAQNLPGDYELEGEGLLEEWYRDYQTEHYRQAYMRDAMEETGASSCEIALEAEKLQDGRYLIRHEVLLQ